MKTKQEGEQLSHGLVRSVTKRKVLTSITRITSEIEVHNSFDHISHAVLLT